MFKKLKYQFFKQNPVKGILSDSDFAQVRSIKKFRSGKTKLFGTPVSFPDPRGFLHSLEEIFGEKVYKFISQKPDPFIIDAGANIGLSVIYFKRLYPQARIVAFEPDPQIYELLRQNVTAFNFETIDLRNAAAWVADTELEFFSEGSLAGSTEIDFSNKNEKYIVKAEHLKKWLSKEKVDFLKIDIEGAENSVLFDLADELPNVQHLFLEYHSPAGKEQMLGEMLNIIKQAGFRYIIKPAAESVEFPFVDRVTNRFDNQLNIFCFRD